MILNDNCDKIISNQRRFIKMTSEIAKRYEDYKKYGNIMLDYDEILLFYPDYFKTKTELEQLNFISKEEANEYFENHYKSSELYKKLTSLALAEDEIYNFMKRNMELKYSQLSLMFKKSITAVIQLCELIDYMGHYPATWPVPKEEEKNPEMEELLEKYDIMIRYHLNDELDKMQITSDDVVRVIETLKARMEYVNSIIKITYNNDWLFTKKGTDEENKEFLDQVIEDLDWFPLSCYQEKDKSKREEGKMYLRRQHGKNII